MLVCLLPRSPTRRLVLPKAGNTFLDPVDPLVPLCALLFPPRLPLPSRRLVTSSNLSLHLPRVPPLLAQLQRARNVRTSRWLGEERLRGWPPGQPRVAQHSCSLRLLNLDDSNEQGERRRWELMNGRGTA